MKASQGKGDSQVGETLALQAQGHEYDLRTYVLKRLSIQVCACNPITKEMETGSLAF